VTRTATGGREPSLDELQALASYAAQRLALYKRRVLLGRGELTRLAELERISAGAAARLRRARDRAAVARPATRTSSTPTTPGDHDVEPTR
jgi:hypothetical protein